MKVDIDTDIPIVRETVKTLGVAGESASTAVAEFLADNIGWASGEDDVETPEPQLVIERLIGELESLKSSADFAIEQLRNEPPVDLTTGKEEA